MISSRYIAYVALQSRGLCESTNATILNSSDSKYFEIILNIICVQGHQTNENVVIDNKQRTFS